MNDLCCEEVVTLRTKVNIFQGIVGVIVSIALVMVVVSNGNASERAKAAAKQDVAIVEKIDAVAEKLQAIAVSLERVTATQEAIVKQLDEHRKAGE